MLCAQRPILLAPEDEEDLKLSGKMCQKGNISFPYPIDIFI